MPCQLTKKKLTSHKVTQQKINTCTLKLQDTAGTGTTLRECTTLNFVNKNGDCNILLEQFDTILNLAKFVGFMYGMC